MIKIPACSALRACLVWQGRELHFIMLCGMWITLRFVWRLKIKNVLCNNTYVTKK